MGSRQATYGASASARSLAGLSALITAAIAYGVGSLVAIAAAYALTKVGYSHAQAVTPRSIEALVNGGRLPHDSLVVFGVVQGLALVAQAIWLSMRGHGTFLAPLLAMLVGWMVAVMSVPFGASDTLVVITTASVQIIVLAAMINRAP